MVEAQNERPQRASLTLNWDLPEDHLLEEFDCVCERVERLWDLRINPQKTSKKARGISSVDDPGIDVVNLKALQFSSAGQVMVPGQGVLEMSSWARQQLGSEIGVRWDKFFGYMHPEEIQHSIASHLYSQPGNVIKRVIARRHEESQPSSVGVLRGFVSPSYAEIPDAQILSRMEDTVGKARLGDMGFFAPKFTDRGSFLRLVYKDPINPLPGVGDTENASYGITLRNSEVGAFSLIGDGFIAKLLCANGMLLRVTEDRWLYRRHRHIEVGQLDELLAALFEQLVNNRSKIQNAYEMLLATIVLDPEEDIRSFMSRNHRPKIELDAAVDAFYVDSGKDRPGEDDRPEPSNAYEVLQGLARFGASIRGDVERQHTIESIAGAYMWNSIAV